MDYSRAIRIARSLADMPQRELAEKISIDPSLISMFESKKRKPTREILEKIADALDIPFHLFALLATEPGDLTSDDSGSINRLAIGLSKLLLNGGERGVARGSVTGRKTQHSMRKPSGRYSEDSSRKTA